MDSLSQGVTWRDTLEWNLKSGWHLQSPVGEMGAHLQSFQLMSQGHGRISRARALTQSLMSVCSILYFSYFFSWGLRFWRRTSSCFSDALPAGEHEGWLYISHCTEAARCSGVRAEEFPIQSSSHTRDLFSTILTSDSCYLFDIFLFLTSPEISAFIHFRLFTCCYFFCFLLDS